MESIKARLRYLVENIDGVARDSNRGRMLATLLYWKVFDGIDIPDEMMRQLMEKGTNPDSIGRLIRFALHDIEKEQRENTEARECVNENQQAIHQGPEGH
ncbi:hypothetical protein D3C85_567350 [compost metagenome]